MKKRLILSVVTLILALSILLSFCSCGKLPELDSELKDRFIYLIEESKELNGIFFGAGLPVYYRDNELSDRLGVYFNDEIVGYNRVIEGTSYLTVDSIKQRAELVYSSDYLSALYETAFDGVMTGNTSAYLRFYVEKKSDRIYIEKGNRHKLEDVNFFTFEPHISIEGSKYDYKKENIYCFIDGKLIEL